MRTFSTILVVSVWLALPQNRAPSPTFNRDVAPILYSNCIVCHRPDEVAPMSLVTFAEARPWARAIKTRVLAHEMPPWYADPRFGEFRNKPTITQTDIDTLAAWVDAGAPEGDGAPPPAPVFGEGWSRSMTRPPDQIIDAPIEFDVPARGEVPTFTVWSKLPFRDDKFVEAMQLLPTSRHVVHHSSVSLGNLPPKTKLGKAALWTGGPVLDGVPIFGDGQPYAGMSGDEFGYPLLFYVSGGGFLRFPPGIAKRLRGGQYLSWGMHHVGHGRAEKTRMRLGLWFAKRGVHHEAQTMTANIKRIVDGKEVPSDGRGRPLIPNIPPHADNWTITGLITFPDDVTLYSMWPHMHYRGKDMTFTLVRPNGREETLLSVPKYNPTWQMTYELAKPLKIPARSTIKAVAHYDNSAKNKFNPAPDQEVVWGPQGINEMFIPFLEVSIDTNDLRFEGVDLR
jgi:hypothetical protein